MEIIGNVMKKAGEEAKQVVKKRVFHKNYQLNMKN